ncbi:MAG: mechanosensitive ion channel family protein [Polyangiaceae bacterium]
MMQMLSNWSQNHTVRGLAAVFIAFLVVRAVTSLLRRSLSAHVRDGNTRYRLRKLVNGASYLLLLVIVTVIFSDRLGGLTVAFGVAGAGVAFALQEVIASFAGWVALSFANFYRVGDRVQLGGIRGDVIDIGMLRTTLMELGQWVDGDLYNGRIVRVANSFVFKEPVFNYSADFHFLWDEIKVPVKHGSDLTHARSVLDAVAADKLSAYATEAEGNWQELVQKYSIEAATVRPTVTLVANDNWVEFTLRYVVDYKRRRSVKDELFTEILSRFAASNGRVAIASMTVHLVETPTLDVRLAS